MSTEKPRFTVTVSDEMKKSIEDFFHSRKFKNQSQAVNQLIVLLVEVINQIVTRCVGF